MGEGRRLRKSDLRCRRCASGNLLGERGSRDVFTLKGRMLTWRGHLLVTTDQKNFYYKYTRELLKDGQMLKQKTWEETIARDHQ